MMLQGMRCMIVVWYIVSCFFFSSRRRHTRFDCDWSSDVCSSDLHALFRHAERRLDATHILGHALLLGAGEECAGDERADDHERDDRSEEHTSEFQSQSNLVCRLLLEKKKTIIKRRQCLCKLPYLR